MYTNTNTVPMCFSFDYQLIIGDLKSVMWNFYTQMGERRPASTYCYVSL